MKKKLLTLTLLVLISLTSIMVSNQTIQNNHTENQTDIKEKDVIFDSFSKNVSDFGSNYSVLLHQSYINQTDLPMNSTNNIISVDQPNDQTFNLSQSMIKINSIVAHNDTLIELPGSSNPTSSATKINFLLASFRVPSTCYLNNISVFGTYTGQEMHFLIYNASWNGSHHVPSGGKTEFIYNITEVITGTGTLMTISLSTAPNILLNTTETVNNTFFLATQPYSGGAASFAWRTDSLKDTQQNYFWDTSLNERFEDYNYNISISPFNFTGLPSDYGMMINNTAVLDVSEQTGEWILNSSSANLGGKLNFNVTSSNWYNLSYTIDSIIVNFTKTDLFAQSEFTVEHGNDVWWNVSFNATYFDEMFSEYYINLSIVEKWIFQSLYTNETILMDPSTYSFQMGKMKILSGNGTYKVYFKSNNIASSLDLIKNAQESSFLYMNDSNVIIRCNLTELVSGSINLSIYDKDDIMKYNSTKSVIDSKLINFDPITISEIITSNGTYKFQFYWYNTTDAAVFLRNVSLVYPTQIQWMPIAEYSEISKNYGQFNISFYWVNTFDNLNISAEGSYKLDGGSPIYFNNTETDNLYNITLDSNSLDLGQHQVEITLEKWGYQNQTYTFTFFIVGTSQLINDTANTVLSVNRGFNATYSFQYFNTTGPIENVSGAVIKAISIHPNFTWSYENTVNGNYSIRMNTSQVDVGLYECRFNVSKAGIPTINITFSVEIKNVSTSLSIIFYNQSIIRRNNENLTAIVFYKDELNDLGIGTALGTNTTVYYGNGTLFGTFGIDYNFEQTNATPGYYTFTLFMKFRPSGNYSIFFAINNLPNYVEALSPIFSFWYTGNTTNISLEDIKYSGGQAIQKSGERYPIFVNNIIKITVRLSDLDQSNQLILNPNAQFAVKNGSQLIYSNSTFAPLINGYEITINLESLPLGNISLTIESSVINYENQTFVLNITIIPKYQLRITTLEKPETVTAGESFVIKIKLEYRTSETADWMPVANKQIRATTVPETSIVTATTNQEGIADFTFTFPVSLDVNLGFKITFIVDGEFDKDALSLELDPFTVHSAPITGIDIKYLYYAGAALAMVGAIVIYKRKVVDVKRADRMKVLINSTNMIEDALNIQHILIIYKNTGVTLFFKTFGQDAFDPNLISGFLTAIQSFGSEIQIKDSISEMKYKENVLLFGEGEMIRVALVLNSSPSDQLKTNLNLFVEAFELKNDAKLKKWRGQLNEFKDSDAIIDEFLNTWVVLPHKLNPDPAVLKQVKTSTCKALIQAARKLIEESGRDMFFISSLLNACVEEERCEVSEATHALIEIRKLKAIVPVSLEQAAPGEMSEDEIRALVERVSALEGFSDADKQKLALQLKDMNPIEREATLVSLEQGIKLKGTFSKQTITPKKYATIKETKKAISLLLKDAKLLKKQGNYDEAILKYEEAEITALQWNLISESKKYKQIAFDTLEEKYKNIYLSNQKEAVKLEKQGNKEEATAKYKLAYEAVQELFKMGILKYEEIGKTLKNKIITLSGEGQSKIEKYVNLTTLGKYYSYLQSQIGKAEKSKNPFLINMHYTELLVVANQLFKMGSVAHADDLRIYKNKIERKLLELSNMPEEKQAEIKNEIAELEETKEKLLALTAQLIEQNNLIQALASYRQIFEIFGKIGDYNNAVALNETIQNILENTENVEEYIQEAEKAANDASDADEKLGHLTIAKSLAHVIYDVKKLTAIAKKMK